MRITGKLQTACQQALRWLSRVGLAAALIGVPLAGLADDATIVAPAGPPIVRTDHGSVLALFTEREYRAQVKALGKKGVGIVALRSVPRDLSRRARYGFGFRYISGPMRSFVVDGDDNAGFTFYLDRNADGDVVDEPAVGLQKNPDGSNGGSFVQDLTDADGNSRSFEVGIALNRLPTGDPAIVVYSEAVRRGTIEWGERAMAFALLGFAGEYNCAFAAVAFDLNGDSTLDLSDGSTEKLEIPEGVVNLKGRSYAFDVDTRGDELRLHPLAEYQADRAAIAAGRAAPEFSVTDLSGATRTLGQYRGRVLVVDFWASWCRPCMQELPALVDLYRRLHPRGLEILGVNLGDAATHVEKLARRHGLTWPQVLEVAGGSGPLQRLFQARGVPAYIVIGPDGTILSTDARPDGRLGEVIERALAHEARRESAER